MLAGTGFSSPPKPPVPEAMPGYVVQAMYTDKQSETGRLTPFMSEDEDFDLQFRGWRINGFATRAPGAEEIHQSQLAFGWQSRILPGVAERVGESWLLHTLH